MTHKKADTFARLGSPLGFVESQDAVETVRLIAEIFRDHGNRADRRHARLKYVVEAWGIERFRDEFARRASFPLHPWLPVGSLAIEDHLGAQPQGDGRYYYGVWVENGRLIDVGRRRTKTAVARAVEALGTRVIVTPSQNLLFADLAGAEVEKLDAILADHGVPRADELSAARRFSLACPALPTCGLALSEAERVMPEILDELEAELAELGLDDEPLTVRATGCPNGCARPYTADVGFVGHGHDQYDVYVGGGLGGDRLADLWEESLPFVRLLDSLRPLLSAWARGRYPGEGLGDFYQRVMGERPKATVLTGEKKPLRGAFEQRLATDAFSPLCPFPENGPNVAPGLFGRGPQLRRHELPHRRRHRMAVLVDHEIALED
jgi:sulfite reductase beta subunit-like hemoprotein